MALEEELVRRLGLHCPRVASPTALFSTPRPYVTWQHIGGHAVRWYDNTAPGFRNAQLQVNTWAATKKAAFDLLRDIEEELCKIEPGVNFTARPMEEPSDSFIENEVSQETSSVYGAMQSFTVWGER